MSNSLEDAQKEVSQIEELRAVWQRRLSDAQSAAQMIEINAGEQVLTGAAPEMIAMDLSGSRASIDIAGKALEALDARLRNAQRSITVARAAALRRQIEEKCVELAAHNHAVAELRRQIELVDQCQWQPMPFPVLGKGAVWDTGAPPPFRFPKSQLLEMEIANLQSQAATLEAQAGAL